MAELSENAKALIAPYNDAVITIYVEGAQGSGFLIEHGGRHYVGTVSHNPRDYTTRSLDSVLSDEDGHYFFVACDGKVGLARLTFTQANDECMSTNKGLEHVTYDYALLELVGFEKLYSLSERHLGKEAFAQNFATVLDHMKIPQEQRGLSNFMWEGRYFPPQWFLDVDTEENMKDVAALSFEQLEQAPTYEKAIQADAFYIAGIPGVHFYEQVRQGKIPTPDAQLCEFQSGVANDELFSFMYQCDDPKKSSWQGSSGGLVVAVNEQENSAKGLGVHYAIDANTLTYGLSVPVAPIVEEIRRQQIAKSLNVLPEHIKYDGEANLFNIDRQETPDGRCKADTERFMTRLQLESSR